MSNFYGVNATKRLVTVPSPAINPGEVNGRVQTLYDKYTFTAIAATTDTLYMGALIPKGARITGVLIKSADLGSTGDINVGWAASAELDSTGTAVEAADADGFFAALDVNAAATTADNINSAFRNLAGVFKKFTAAVQITIQPSEITTATAGDIEILVSYVVD